jgi:hypothetical protein
MILIAAVLHSILGEDLPESKCGQLTKETAYKLSANRAEIF